MGRSSQFRFWGTYMAALETPSPAVGSSGCTAGCMVSFPSGWSSQLLLGGFSSALHFLRTLWDPGGHSHLLPSLMSPAKPVTLLQYLQPRRCVPNQTLCPFHVPLLLIHLLGPRSSPSTVGVEPPSPSPNALMSVEVPQSGLWVGRR